MTYEVIITPEAEQQIINLHRYITQKAGNVIADNYANALLDYLDGFSTFPHRGNKRDDIRQGMRVTHFRHRTIIAFAVDSRKVFIVGIYHGETASAYHLARVGERQRPIEKSFGCVLGLNEFKIAVCEFSVYVRLPEQKLRDDGILRILEHVVRI